MPILTSVPGADNSVKIYDIPESELSQFEVSGEKCASMFPESNKQSGGSIPKSTAEMSPMHVENSEGLGEVQAYNAICVCREILCNHWGHCWWHYYYCYC